MSKKSPWIIVLLPLIVIVILIINSCNPSKDIKLYEQKYSKDSVDKLMANAAFKKLVVQFYTSDISKNPTQFQLVAYAVDFDSSKCKMIYLKRKDIGSGRTIPNPDTLTHVRDSVHTFQGDAIFGNLEISRDAIFKATHNPDGSAFDYDFLYCRPKRLAYTNHIYYTVYAVKNGIKVLPPPPTEGDTDLNPRPPAD